MTDLFSATSPAQWRIESMQLVNWGSWHGHHELTFDRISTLLAGASGSGKSTVMDAYTALMMPGTVPFNNASNSAVSGRARSDGQRNEVSYIRGKQGDVHDDTSAGLVRAKVLRGADGTTWSAVGATFVSSLGEKFTAFRAYILPAGRTSMSDDGVIVKWATHSRDINLSELQMFAAGKFYTRDLEGHWPGIQVAKGVGEFSAKVTTRLGICGEDGGKSALLLLARVQAGRAVSTVDDTYKSMVLDIPDTFDRADKALKHFEDLEASYEELRVVERKSEILKGITAVHDRIRETEDLLHLLDSFGAVEETGDTPLVVWATEIEQNLVSAAEEANSTARATSREMKMSAAAEEAQLNARLGQIRREQDDAGGSTLDRIDHDIDILTTERDRAQDARRTFDRYTNILGSIESTEELTNAVNEAATFNASYEPTRSMLQDQRTELVRSTHPIHAAMAELKAERESLEGRSGRVPKALHDIRVQIAQATGLPLEDFQFAAELINVPPQESQWRLAIETVLFGLARTLLVDKSSLERISEALDPLHIGTRLHFEGVNPEEFHPYRGDPSRVSGKLEYKPGPYTNWVAAKITSSKYDAVCVASAQDLRSNERRLTMAGQVRHGDSGAHGGSRTSQIIGFTSEERLAEIDQEITGQTENLRHHDEQIRSIDNQLERLESLRAAYQQAQSTTWRSIDVEGIEKDITELQNQRSAILASSDRLLELSRQAQSIESSLEDARSRKHDAIGQLTRMETEQAELVDRSDELAETLNRIQKSGTTHLSQEQRTQLDAIHSEVGRPGDLSTFRDDLEKVKTAALSRSAQARKDMERDSNALVTTFKQFNLEFGNDNNRGETLQDYDDFKVILDDIDARGLAGKRHRFTEDFTQWTSDDLLALQESFEGSIRKIEERMVPVNAILATLDFGPHRQRLRIHLARRIGQDVKDFRQELRQLSSSITRELTAEEVVDRFMKSRNFLNRLRKKPKAYVDSTYRQQVEAPNSVREAMLDVRRHVKITAVASDQNGTPQTTYDAIGHLSGGETQELVAFIVGAALRYQLGNDEESQSMFAPVWLDEAFIKADSEFTSRAINAWLGFGFQLIIAAPNEKMAGLEPLMTQITAITKSSRGHSNATPMVRKNHQVA